MGYACFMRRNLSTQLINPNFCVSHRRSATVSLETNPLISLLLVVSAEADQLYVQERFRLSPSE